MNTLAKQLGYSTLVVSLALPSSPIAYELAPPYSQLIYGSKSDAVIRLNDINKGDIAIIWSVDGEYYQTSCAQEAKKEVGIADSTSEIKAYSQLSQLGSSKSDLDIAKTMQTDNRSAHVISSHLSTSKRAFQLESASQSSMLASSSDITTKAAKHEEIRTTSERQETKLYASQGESSLTNESINANRESSQDSYALSNIDKDAALKEKTGIGDLGSMESDTSGTHSESDQQALQETETDTQEASQSVSEVVVEKEIDAVSNRTKRDSETKKVREEYGIFALLDENGNPITITTNDYINNWQEFKRNLLALTPDDKISDVFSVGDIPERSNGELVVSCTILPEKLHHGMDVTFNVMVTNNLNKDVDGILLLKKSPLNSKITSIPASLPGIENTKHGDANIYSSFFYTRLKPKYTFRSQYLAKLDPWYVDFNTKEKK